MNRERLLLGVASVLAGTAVLMAILGVTFNLVFVVLALPFGAAAYFLWSDATGRLQARMRRRMRSRAGQRADGGRTRGMRGRGESARRGRSPGGRARTRGSVRSPRSGGPTLAEARRVLNVGADAGTEEIREAYRERVKDAHPDREGGSEEEFKRVQDAYDRLREE